MKTRGLPSAWLASRLRAEHRLERLLVELARRAATIPYAVCTTASAAFTASTYVFGSPSSPMIGVAPLRLQPLGLFRIARQRRDPVATLDHRVEHGRPDVSGGARQKHCALERRSD